MKTTSSLALAALLASGHAVAQNVTIYGLLDVSVEYITHVGATNGHLTRMPSNTGTFPSALGFRGSEDLGDGLAAVFTLEMGLVPDQGTLGQGGRAFGRQAFVGVSAPWGTVSLGRQYTMLFWSLLDANIMGPNLYGTGSLDSALPNARSDNSIAYKGRFGGLTLGATYSLGRDTVNAGPSPVGMNCPGESASDSKACREWSALAKYDAPSWGTALAYVRANGRTVGTPPDAVFGGLNSSGKSDSRLNVNGYLKLGSIKLGAGLVRRHNEGDQVKPKSDLWYVGASYPITPLLALQAGVASLRYKGVADRNSTLLSARLAYALSKRTTVYSQVGTIDNESLAAVSVSSGAVGSNPAVGRSQAALNFGMRHSF